MPTIAKKYKIVRSSVIEDEELPEIHRHNDIDQPKIKVSDIPAGTDHDNLSNVTNDQHHARDHASRHLAGGGDTVTLTATEVPTGTSWAANIVPDATNTRDLGSATRFYNNLFVTNTEIDGDLNHDGTNVGFYGVTPAARPSAYTQTYATADKTHDNFTSADIGAFTGGTVGFVDAAERDNIRTQFNALRVDVADLKQLVNSVVDDLQNLGLLQ